MTEYPRILIIGQPFNQFSGGGITISNLFKHWPKEKLFLATNTHRASKNDFSLCKNVYRLGKKEVKTPLMLRPFLKVAASGIIKDNDLNHLDKNRISVVSKSHFLYKYLAHIVNRLDLSYLFFRIKISKEFDSWINEIKPEIVYSQLGHLEFNYFVYDIRKAYNIPLVIHIMDDWPENSSTGIFRFYWQKKISKSFLKILSVTDELITISESMKNEYNKRYNKGKFYFHNPIKIDQKDFEPYSGRQEKGLLKIAYFGRIGFSNINTIRKITSAVESLYCNGHLIYFDIYTPDLHLESNKKSIYNIRFLKPVSHDNVPNYLKKYDLLVLPLDFDKDSRKYIRYSFPTKASEYMVSRRLILVFGPEDAAVVKHAKSNNWALVLDKNNIEKLKEILLDVYYNLEHYEEIINKAYNIAKNEFEEEIVLASFLDVFKQLLNKTDQ